MSWTVPPVPLTDGRPVQVGFSREEVYSSVYVLPDCVGTATLKVPAVQVGLLNWNAAEGVEASARL